MTLTAPSGILVFIGSYSEASEAGLFSCSFDAGTGSLTLIDQAAGLRNPSFLDVDEERMKLYAICVEQDSDGRNAGAAASYDVDPATGTFAFLNKQRTVEAPTCHITLDRTRRYLIVTSYHGGLIGLSPVADDGRIGPLADAHRREGASIRPVQTQSRLHSAFLDPANRFAMVSDLGADKIVIYRLDADGGKLVLHGEAQVRPGAGPRHFAFHPALNFGYVINELDSTITAFAFDPDLGLLKEIQTISTLPEGYAGESFCADIHISPDGRFLYGSNRGHDSMAVFAVDPADGRLEAVEHVSTRGSHPRNFALSPDGRFLLVANMHSDQIVAFARDDRTGRLQPTGFELRLPKPVCIKFWTVRDPR